MRTRAITTKLEKIFAKNLIKLRSHESQIKFSKRIGIAQSTLNRLENREASPTLQLIEKIASRLKIDPLELLKPLE